MGFHLALLMLVALFSGVEMVQVKVTQGTVEGEVLTTIVGNTTYHSFKGIPYAAPPVGNLRFKAPEPPVKWTEVWNATSFGSTCPQKDILTSVIIPGSEDCLYLNVYSPDLEPESPLAVIFYIHGGGFVSGTGSDYGPDFLINQGVVIVTINYRLGALGFLSMGTEDVPGNAGLKDQVAALKWVKDNIASFGGDPDNVTIMGQSAGGASVTYHLLSPMSRGLFSRAIALSSTALCDYVTEFESVRRAFRLGRQAGIYTDDTSVLLESLQNVTVDKLYNTNCSLMLSEINYNIVLHTYDFPPVKEVFSNDNTFQSQSVLEILKNGNINEADVMLGYASQETSTIISLINSSLFQSYDRNPEMFVPTQMYFDNTPAVNLNMGEMIQKYYFANASLDVNVMDKFITYTGDSAFVRDILRFMNLLATRCNKNLYLFEFAMSSALNVYGNQADLFGFHGSVGHLDDLQYLFPTILLNRTLLEGNSTELSLINQFCTLVANFAKYGNPTPSSCSGDTTWPQFDTTTQSYLEIGNSLTVKTAPKTDMMAFWQTIFEDFGFEF